MAISPVAGGILSAGSGLLQAGGSIASGIIGRDAAKEAEAAQMDALLRSLGFLGDSQDRALSLLDPFISSGTQARDFLTAALYGPEAAQAQRQIERARLESTIRNLEQQWGGTMDENIQRLDKTTAFLTGKNASERRHALMMEQVQKGKEELQRAQQALTSFDAESGAFDKFGQAVRAQFDKPLEASPLYQFQVDIGTRNINRELAARGLHNSGAGLETLATFVRGLGAEETERQFARKQAELDRLFQMFSSGQNASTNASNIIMSFAQPMAANMVQQGQVQAQGAMNRAAATQGMITGVGNAITGGVGQFLNFDMAQNMMNLLARNKTGQQAGNA